MGAHPYYYSVKYQPDAAAALEDLRQREFQAGRYNPVLPFLRFPIRPDSPAPGAKHQSIDEARAASAESGTRSILDIIGVAEEPDFFIAAPLPNAKLEQYFGTVQPTKEMVSKTLKFIEAIERGHCIYFTVFEDGRPSELIFAGYSFD
jgi:hypothetical protein